MRNQKTQNRTGFSARQVGYTEDDFADIIVGDGSGANHQTDGRATGQRGNEHKASGQKARLDSRNAVSGKPGRVQPGRARPVSHLITT